MIKNTLAKKVWQKLEVSDLDVNRTSSAPSFGTHENAYSGGEPAAQ